MSQVPAVISNTATAGAAITTRTTGAATVTMTAEEAADIMTIGVATVATKIIDGDDTKKKKKRGGKRIPVKTLILHKFVDSLLKKKKVSFMKYVDKFTCILRLFVHDPTSLKI